MTTVLEEITEIKTARTKQKQIPQEKIVKIDQLMPLWSHLLDLVNQDPQDPVAIVDWKTKHDLDIGDYHRCMAGEIHKFSDWYKIEDDDKYCLTCERYAQDDFPDLLADIESNCIYIGKDWRNSKSVVNFIDHWNHDHISRATN